MSVKILPVTDASVLHALQILRDGGIVAHGTETCYGFACDLTNKAAVEKLFAIKERGGDQPVSGLFASVEEARKFVAWNARAKELADQYLPGPLTLILSVRDDVPFRIFPTPSGGSTLGIRVSSHPLAVRLAAAFGRPLSTTSANLHGQPNPYSPTDIAKQFEGKVLQPALILDSGILPPNAPSTVIDLTEEARIRRRGSVNTE